MTGIGITDWRRYDSSYPLNASSFIGLFADAVFVLFDTETPVLQTIEVAQQLSFVFQFDGVSSVIFQIDYAQAQQDSVIQLRYNNRYYGALTLGPLIESVAAGNSGAIVNINTSFNPNTVRTINSKNGVYSLQSQHGNVTITTTDDLIVKSTFPLEIDAISVPNELTTTPSNPQLLYLWNSSLQTLTTVGATTAINIVNPTSITGFGTTSNVASIDLITTVLDTNNDVILIGVSYDTATTSTDVYNCSVYPWQKITSISGIQLIDLTAVGQTLYGLTSTAIVSLGTYPFNTTPVSYILSMPGMLKLVGVPATSGAYFVVTKPGPNDPLTSTQISDLFYKATVSGLVATCSSVGVFTWNNDYHRPTTSALAMFSDLNGNNIMLVASGSGVYQLPVSDQYINAAQATSYSAIVNNGNAVKLLPGGWSVVFAPVTPLKSMNSTGPSNNSVQFIGDDIIMINRTGPDEITIAVSVPDSLLNIQRTASYG